MPALSRLAERQVSCACGAARHMSCKIAGLKVGAAVRSKFAASSQLAGIYGTSIGPSNLPPAFFRHSPSSYQYSSPRCQYYGLRDRYGYPEFRQVENCQVFALGRLGCVHVNSEVRLWSCPELSSRNPLHSWTLERVVSSTTEHDRPSACA